jgi:orotidine-5'-phosphate decarboxylase
MTFNQLVEHIRSRASFLCVGLDTDPLKIPALLTKEKMPMLAFNKAIIDATAPYCVAYKPNTAFYEAQGVAGWLALEKTVDYIRTQYPDKFLIADAKRGDIGNTSKMYAETFFRHMDFDAVTLSPYMGYDTVAPFFDYPGKWAVVLGLTSNASAAEMQMQPAGNKPMYQHVLASAAAWGNKENTMFVVGATKAKELEEVRKIVPEHFLLVPGVGAQGGSLTDVANYGLTPNAGLLVNSSRGIIYAGAEEDFAEAAAAQARQMQKQMKNLLPVH